MCVDVYTLRGYIVSMKTTPTKALINRLKRIEGQSASLRDALEHGATCETVIPQFLAVKGALDATLQVYLRHSLTECKGKQSADEMSNILNVVIKKLT